MTEPLKCTQCHRTEWSINAKLAAEWANRDYAKGLCPYCLRKFVVPRPESKPRCAGCGKKTKALRQRTCKKCRDAGVEAPTLFEQE